ncbi:hypothetical protein L1286_20025 [Pseudoalteromonas sp. SMS1]|uniref:DUF6882 domain-containing protein n=1 Tax=Pseudoalteromonas sp. SMS1 TaxID=2908894 RepID=UPI001F2C384E|nr:DUF6882 domain-containing protein [Pseudoalteromonas sp. SMS1]MCF2859773.1 hypothetical protein [Pseudoalteromonas sp. SMS1]
MNKQELKHFLAASYEMLQGKQNELDDKFGLSYFESFKLAADEARIFFSTGSSQMLGAQYTPIGSFLTSEGVWTWSWQNVTFTEERAIARLQKRLNEKGLSTFADSVTTVDEDMVWQWVAASVDVLAAQGIYKVQESTQTHFFALHEVCHIE